MEILTDWQTDRPTDIVVHREVKLPKRKWNCINWLRNIDKKRKMNGILTPTSENFFVAEFFNSINVLKSANRDASLELHLKFNGQKGLLETILAPSLRSANRSWKTIMPNIFPRLALYLIVSILYFMVLKATI